MKAPLSNGQQVLVRSYDGLDRLVTVIEMLEDPKEFPNIARFLGEFWNDDRKTIRRRVFFMADVLKVFGTPSVSDCSFENANLI